MIKRIKIFFLLLICLFSLTACQQKKVNNSRTAKTEEKAKFKDTPTLYFHGLMGSAKNERPFAKEVKKSGATGSVTHANVDEKGRVKLVGTIKRDAKNPLILVDYKDNVQPNFKRNGIYATNVVKALQKKYHIKKINMIGYSLGNMSIIYYQLQNGKNKKMPRLVKQVSIGGHYDGAYFKELPDSFRQPKGLKLDKNNKPNKMNQTFKQMTKVRPIYRAHPVKVLNVIGNIGNGSDGVVEEASAKSLKYLVSDSPYQEYQVDTDHGSLPSNEQVINKMIEFLW